jgi:undecaprenyl-diphosphatase
MIRRAHKFAHRITYGEPLILLPLLLVVGGLYAFAQIVDEVLEGESKVYDEWTIRFLRRTDDPSIPIGPAWMHEAARDITALGSMIVLVLVIAAVAGFLILRRKYGMLWLVLAASSGGIVLSQLMKNIFARPRPDLVPHSVKVFTASFPSGHSMMSAVVYLTLGTLLAQIVPGWKGKIYCLSIAVFFAVLVGLSRIYLGVHYPTDVMAGWAAGLVWALMCWFAAAWLQRRGAVERTIAGSEAGVAPAASEAA